MAKDTKESGMSTGIKVGLAAAGAAAAAAAGYYFYASKNAKAHRRIVASWAKDLKHDVMRQAKKVKNLNSTAVATIVDEAAQAYHNVRNIDTKDVAKAAEELKRNWLAIRAELQQTHKRKTAAKRKAKKSVRKRTAKSST